MTEHHDVGRVTPADYATILEEHSSFWGERDLRPAHHPVLVHEFAGTSVALRDGDVLLGYLFGFVEGGFGYVHLIGVREGHRRGGVATRLWAEFERIARARGAHTLKAITTPANGMSIGFHRSMGMDVDRVSDYAGPGHDRIVFTRALAGGSVAGLDHVLVAAPPDSDDQARAFYGGLLGLAEMAKPEALGPGVWFQLAGGQLHIGAHDDFTAATKAHPGLEVSLTELEVIAARLQAGGAEVRRDERLDDRKRFYTYDPWGNRVEVLARR